MKVGGFALLAIGLAILAYAWTMNVTVPYGFMYWESTVNADLLSRRTMLTVVGAVAIVSGVILFSLRARNSGGAQIASNDGNRPCPCCAESIKVEAKKCRYCGHEFSPSPAATTASTIPVGSSDSHGWVVILPAVNDGELTRRLGVAREMGMPVVSGSSMPIHCGFYEDRASADIACQRVNSECHMGAMTKYIPPQ